MPLTYAQEPKNGAALVQAGLRKQSQRQGAVGAMVDPTTAKLNPPHAVYDLRADDIADGGGLASARASGYRYIVGGAGTRAAAAEVTTDASGTATLLANLNFGPYVNATTKALAQLQTLPEVSSASYEVRLLRFSAISLMALWLKAASGGADIIYPLDPAPAGIQAGRPYSSDDFINAIYPLAQKRASAIGPSVP
jgi:hypothetical protein